ncbi:GNAT family N-acetyltransferase [Streptomyces flavofungini]|uniref:GNAT family N-acetyltransferase n=1 Tax=Streptomyces flavofungini TaxID=68200 RepID=A0ABS0X3H1_9ACTN|nr:GNAT family N-acetyltransferase [Streptomyces flavofungini]MBJ3807589.1 GNAT family N-acetyltransferase [Streptomyces flavofungini]GHC64632.1 histone acetyltransferase [Streptomyces flavofungini]
MNPPAATVTLRPATEADARAVADVYLRSYDAALPTVRRAHSDDEVRDFFRYVVVGRGGTWVAEAAGEVVGMMVLEAPAPQHGPERTELSQLYLSPDWRGRGIGDRFVALAKERSPTGLSLHTFQVNEPAHRFYDRHGFTADRWTDGADNEEREPDVRYVWRP